MRPQVLKTPKKGQLFGSLQNNGVCDTFDWAIHYLDNLRGDNVYVELDRSNPDIPIIRFKDDFRALLEAGGGCDCDVTAYYTEYDEGGNRNVKIATWTNGKLGEAKKTVDIYAPKSSGGGGGANVSITPTYDVDGNKINYDAEDTNLDPYAKA